MAWLPYINDYHPLYIQADGDDKAWGTETYGLVAKSSPYHAFPEPKDPYKNDFRDENGDDEADGVMHFKSFTFKVQFYVKTFDDATRRAVDVLREQESAFFEKIKEGEFKVYDSYTGLGRQKVRYAGYEESGEGFMARDNWARHVFSVSFKVNDPVTAMTLSGGVIVPIT